MLYLSAFWQKLMIMVKRYYAESLYDAHTFEQLYKIEEQRAKLVSHVIYKRVLGFIVSFHFFYGLYIGAKITSLLTVGIPYVLGYFLTKCHKDIIHFITHWSLGGALLLIFYLVEYGEFISDIKEFYEFFGHLFPFCLLVSYLAFKVYFWVKISRPAKAR